MTDEKSKPLTPKRGAFPTPKEVLDKAPPFIPDEADESPADKHRKTPPDSSDVSNDGPDRDTEGKNRNSN